MFREGVKKKKIKKVEFSTFYDLRGPPPSKGRYFFSYFSMFQHILSIFGKKMIFPLKIWNHLENLHQFGPQRRRNPPISPSPPSLPLTKGKFFFAFLDVSDHLEAKKKKKRDVENHPILPPPPVKMWKIPHFFFFFFFEHFPN